MALPAYFKYHVLYGAVQYLESTCFAFVLVHLLCVSLFHMLLTCSCTLSCKCQSTFSPWLKLHQLVCVDFLGALWPSDLLSVCTAPFSRLHPSPSDLWHGHRLHLSVLELGLWREGSLHAVRQCCLQAPVRQHRHRPQVVSLPPVHHHMAVFEKELQEIHQEQRGLPHSHRTLCLQCDSGQFGQGDHAESSQQDKVHIQPRGPWDV